MTLEGPRRKTDPSLQDSQNSKCVTSLVGVRFESI
jgi:hypothetical protein